LRDTGTAQVTLGELLGDRTFGLYLIGQTTSGAGSALSSIALVFAVLAISPSAGSVGLVLLASRLPAIALTVWGGIIADRWSRRRIAISADVCRMLIQAFTGLLLLSGQATVVTLTILQLTAGAAGAIFGPAAVALAAGVAPRGQIRRASSILGITTAVAQTGGLALSGIIVAFAGPGASLLIDSATFAVSSVAFTLMPSTAVLPAVRTPALMQLRDGWRSFIARRWLVIYAIHETTLNVLALSPFFVLGPVIAKEHLGGAPAWSAIALGYVLGNLLAGQITYLWAPRRPVLATLLISMWLAPMLALLGLGAPIWLIAPAALLAGAQSTIYNTLINSTQQANLPADLLGRVTAITGMGSTILVPAGMGLAGLMASEIGASTVLISGAALVVAATLVCAAHPSTRERLRLDRPG
jgi:MFS family permease